VAIVASRRRDIGSGSDSCPGGVMARIHCLLPLVLAAIAVGSQQAHAQPNDGFQQVRPTPLPPPPRPPTEQRSPSAPTPGGLSVSPPQPSILAATVACSAHMFARGRGPFRQQIVMRIADRRLTYERTFGGGASEAGVEQAAGQVSDNGDVTVVGNQIAAGRSVGSTLFRGNIYGPAPQLRGEYREPREGRVYRTCEINFIDQPRR
jgi:hypothetical protein